jgi:hypothetical protein
VKALRGPLALLWVADFIEAVTLLVIEVGIRVSPQGKKYRLLDEEGIVAQGEEGLSIFYHSVSS